MYILGKNIYFPPPSSADENGLLAIGGDLSSERLIYAYQNGIFPWFNPGEPFIWYCPPERMVLYFDELKVSKSMKQLIRSDRFELTYNENFTEVIRNCKTIYRPDQGGTWITDEMERAYIELHYKGFAKSVEVWENGVLVGGLYGIDLGHVFTGESMFSKVSNTSKLAFVFLCESLKKDNYALLDCQVYNPHLERLGAREIPRSEFLKVLHKTSHNKT
ncbi:leucyl/phenylalanyl-tRNA--protein transferase [Namhaeicola litoreus]|uniref:Leucyl/phenylalanyl-tRNA--protein transferase n=1 Tax=Namhaeicola litoreus TaxID=1052145 RepID=A0ABW3XXC7_9FLAO